MKKTLIISLVLGIFAWLLGNSHSGGEKEIAPSVFFVLPFIAILLCIALAPLINGKWWHHNFPKVSLILGLPMAFWTIGFNWHWLYHTVLDYVSFIVLLGSLFVISGGINIKGDIKATPFVNSMFLIIGAILASLIGTTGASMLLIRPLLKTNAKRNHTVHTIVFFIFIVSNIGGSLTPLGDPPLFLGFLQGVEFFWTLKLAPAWAFSCICLIIIFYIIDSFYAKKESSILSSADNNPSKIQIKGTINFLYLLGILGAVILYSLLPKNMIHELKTLIQITIMLLMTVLSHKTTHVSNKAENNFTWFPIKEVAILFACIFATMIPALKLLEIRGAELGVSHPWQFFWMSGILSSFLDNAPTYLSFLSLGKPVTASLISATPSLPVIVLSDGSKVAESILIAISLGSVFMGANSYIGNGPNFMVKSVAEHAGIKMPSFLGYMMWSIGILIPLFCLVTFIFVGVK